MKKEQNDLSEVQVELENLQAMEIIYGGAIIIIAVVLTGVVCVLGGIQIPFMQHFTSNSFAASPSFTHAHMMHAASVAGSAATSTQKS